MAHLLYSARTRTSTVNGTWVSSALNSISTIPRCSSLQSRMNKNLCKVNEASNWALKLCACLVSPSLETTWQYEFNRWLAQYAMLAFNLVLSIWLGMHDFRGLKCQTVATRRIKLYRWWQRTPRSNELRTNCAPTHHQAARWDLAKCEARCTCWGPLYDISGRRLRFRPERFAEVRTAYY